MSAHVLADWRYGASRLLFATPIYRFTLNGRAPGELHAVPPDPWPGDAERGAAIVAGTFGYDGEIHGIERGAWRTLEASEPWLGELNGFDWLRDLRAVGGDAPRWRARELVSQWLASEAGWHALTWRPDVVGRRVFAWLGQHDFFCASADDTFRSACYAGISRQARHLARTLPGGTDGEGLFAAIKGLIVAGLALAGHRGWVVAGARLLERECARQIMADGGHVSRCPADQAAVLRHLVDIRAALLAAGHEPPAFLVTAIDRAAPVLRMLRHGDGRLALFNGGAEGADWQLDMLLSLADARGRPPASAPHVGFERLAANRMSILIDVGGATPAGFDAVAHAGALAFELSVGKERLITNCGARPARRPPWGAAQRATAAHSTLVIDDTNSAPLKPAGGFERRPQPRAHERRERDGDVWLSASHDGYVANYGLVHQRALWLGVGGDDVRGTDTLVRAGAGATRPRGFAIRFHLHPAVKASLVQDGTAVLLRPPSGRGWRLAARGAALSLADSVYLGGAGPVRRTDQVVLSGAIGQVDGNGAVADVKWALKRLARRG